jgi:hypothetical protein
VPNKNINDRQQSWLDAQKAARPLCKRYTLRQTMIVTHENFDQFTLNHFKRLPNEISIKEGNDNLSTEDFNKVFHSVESRNAKNVIYIWRCESKIPRLKGESNIVYIGQTSKSLFTRHGSSSIKVNSIANKQKYNDIVKRYGAISMSYIKLSDFDNRAGANLLKAEGQCLWWYFKNHSEYPPVNYTKTKVRNEQLEINV